MLVFKDVHKTFNRGSANEKIALKGITLSVNEGELYNRDRRKRRRKIHHAEHDLGSFSGGQRNDKNRQEKM